MIIEGNSKNSSSYTFSIFSRWKIFDSPHEIDMIFLLLPKTLDNGAEVFSPRNEFKCKTFSQFRNLEDFFERSEP